MSKQIKEMALTAIKPYENNPRKNENAVEKVAESIKAFGFQQPIVVDKDNVIIAGHTRYKAAELLGLKKVPVIKASELSEEEVKAYRLADNKTAEFADWDFELLDAELESIGHIDMTRFGFEFIDEQQQIIEDDYNEEAAPVRTKEGEMYRLGEHLLLCGDSTKQEDVDILMGDDLADLVFTDPPYGVSYKGTNNPNGREWEIIKNDELRGDNLFLFLLEAFKNIKRKLKQGGRSIYGMQTPTQYNLKQR